MKQNVTLITQYRNVIKSSVKDCYKILHAEVDPVVGLEDLIRSLERFLENTDE